MSMAPVPTTSSTQPGGSAGQSVASAAPRVTPVPAATAGQGVNAGGAGIVTTPLTAQAGNLAQQISAQALLTLLQTLGKPLSGTIQSGGSAGSLPLQVTMPPLTLTQSGGPKGTGAPHANAQNAAGPVSGGRTTGSPTPVNPAPANPSATAHVAPERATGNPATKAPSVAPSPNSSPNSLNAAPRQLIISLPVPKGTIPPAPGTPVQVQAEGSGNAVRIGVTVTGQAPVSADSLRVDTVRQASLAPLMGDVTKLARQPSTTNGVTAAIERLMGFTLDADAPLNGQALRTAVEGGRGGPAVSGKPAPQTPPGSQQSGTVANTTPQTAHTVQTMPTLTSPDRPVPTLPSPAFPQTAPSIPLGATATGTANTMQTALGALIRALGLVQSDAGGTHSRPIEGQVTAPAPGKAVPTSGKSVPPPPADARPSKLPATPLPADAPDLSDPAQIQALKSKAEGALSRLNLLQAQDSVSGQRGSDSVSALRWDVPLIIGQEAALLGVAIEKDGGQGSEKDGGAHTWRFRFSFESRTLGGIEGVVALHQSEESQHIDVAVWAGEPHVLSRLEARRPGLVERLQALNLTVDSLTLGSTDDLPEPAEQPERHRVDVLS